MAPMSAAALPPFHRVLDLHGGAVMRWLSGNVGGDAAEDCFQETMLSALRAYPRLREDSNIRGWLLTIARRKAIDWDRARRRRPMLAPDETLAAVAGSSQTAGTDPELWQ